MDQGRGAKRRRLTGFTDCRQRVGLGDLPEDLLLLIFSFLQPSCFRPLRLVCRSFRRASVPYVTGLRLGGGTRSSVASALHAFPKIASLTIQAPVAASSEQWPQSVRQLSSLAVHRSAMHDSLQLTGLLSHLQGLTSLTLLHTEQEEEDEEETDHPQCSLQDIVDCCPALRSLELEEDLISWVVDCRPCFFRLTALQELKLFCGTPVWDSLLPCLTCLPHLRTLTSACVDFPQHIAPLAALTQLTSLGGYMELPLWLICLPALTGLKRVSVAFPWGGEPTDVLTPLLRCLPTSLLGLCLYHMYWSASEDDLRVLSEMMRLDHLETGHTTPDAMDGCGFWSLQKANPWCKRLVGLRHLGLVGRPTGAPDVRLIAKHLTGLEHLRLRLELFDDVRHLSALTRLTLLHLYMETREGACARALGPPGFLAPLQQLRHLSLHWEIMIGEEQETVLCLAALEGLEGLHVTLVPLERARVQASLRLRSGVGGKTSLGAARGPHRQRNGHREQIPGNKQHAVKRRMGIQMLQPLVRLGSLQEVQVEGGYKIDKRTWERIQQLRGRLGLPDLSPGSLLTKTGEVYSNELA